ncbi:hypothetical protein MTO96_023771 [Rhipicephalus appendiculatus]
MQCLTKPATPRTTSAALRVSTASCFAAATAVPTLSQPCDVNNTTPTALGQPAAFLSRMHTSNADSVRATPSLKATLQPACVVTMPTTHNALNEATRLEPVTVVTQSSAFVVTNTCAAAPESESRNTASALQSAALAPAPTGSAPGIASVNAESAENTILKSGVPLTPQFCPPLLWLTRLRQKWASQRPKEITMMRPTPKVAGPPSVPTGNLPRPPDPASKLITVGIQLPPGTLTPKLPLYDLLASIIAAANLSPKTSAEVTLQAKPAQRLVFQKTHSPLTAHLLLSLTNLELNGKLYLQ